VTSHPQDLHKPDQQQMTRLEREMAAVNVDYKKLEASYGDDVLALVFASGYLERLLSKPAIEWFLESRHPEFATMTILQLGLTGHLVTAGRRCLPTARARILLLYWLTY
jgi:hypothetical protein